SFLTAEYSMKRLVSISIACVFAIALVALAPLGRAAAPACDPDNGGLKLPDGFCAAVVADDLGPARHLVAAPNGDVFVSVNNERGKPGGGVARRRNDGDG